MNHGVMFRGAAIVLLFYAGSAFAQTPSVQPPAQADAAATTAPVADGGDVAELQQLIREAALTELRTTYNGSFGASLLFDPVEMEYWVALFQHKTFWRVVRTHDPRRAGTTYQAFVRKTWDLSDLEIERVQLEAQTAATNRRIAELQDRASRLRADLVVANAQSRIAAGDRQQTRTALTTLLAQRHAAQTQLRDTGRQVQQLRRQLDDGLPGGR